MAQRHPKVLVNFLAYSHVTDCPAGAEPLGDNVLVGLCLFPRPTQRTMRPLETSPQELDRNLRPQIPAWQKLSKHFYIYEYYTLSNRHEAWKMVKFWSMVSMIREDIGFLRRQRCGRALVRSVGRRRLVSVEHVRLRQTDLESGPQSRRDHCRLLPSLLWQGERPDDRLLESAGGGSARVVEHQCAGELARPAAGRTDRKALSQVADNARERYRIHAIKALHRSYWPE